MIGKRLARSPEIAQAVPSAWAGTIEPSTSRTESPALRACEQQIFARFTDSLAALLAAERAAPSGAIEPWVIANALMGVNCALVTYTRDRIIAGARNPKLSRDVRAQGRVALAALQRGFAGDQ